MEEKGVIRLRVTPFFVPLGYGSAKIGENAASDEDAHRECRILGG